MADIIDTIQTTAEDGIQRAAVDGRSADAVPIPDLIAADKYIGGSSAKSRPARGLRFTKLLKGGQVDDLPGGCR